MKLFYITNLRLPTEKAHGHQIMKMCEAFVNNGMEVTLAHSKRRPPKQLREKDPFAFYGIKKNYEVRKLWSLDLIPWVRFLGKLAGYVQAYTFTRSAVRFIKSDVGEGDIIYTRTLILAKMASNFHDKVIYEANDANPPLKDNANDKFFIKITRVVVVNEYLKNRYIERFPVLKDRVVVAPNGIDPKMFAIEKNKLELREELNLPIEEVIIGYVGKLKTTGLEKGVDILFKSAVILKERGRFFRLLLVGGSQDDNREYADLADALGISDKIIFLPHQPHTLVPRFEMACDILVMPFPKIPHYETNMSPLKMFEYAAAGRPIVASRLPSIEMVLSDEENCLMVIPEDHRDLADKIEKIMDDENLSIRLSRNAKELSKVYTWEQRANKVINKI